MEYRTHARPRSVRIKKKNAPRTAIVLILSIILISVIIALSPLGSILADNVFSPVFQKIKGENRNEQIVSALSQQEITPDPTSSPEATVSAESVIMIDETPFYILQMGVFTDESDAKEHADEIGQMGAGGFVYPDNAVFRVFAAAYLDENSLIKVQSQIRSDGFEATPYITESSKLKITLKGDQTAVDEAKKAIGLITEVPVKLSELALSYDKGEYSDQEVKEQVQNLLSKCEEQLRFFESMNDETIDRISSVLRKYQKTISTFLNEYDSIVSDERSGALKHLQIETIIDYILFFDQT